MPYGTRVERCVEDVKKEGGGVNPYAVCAASTGQDIHTGQPLKKGLASPRLKCSKLLRGKCLCSKCIGGEKRIKGMEEKSMDTDRNALLDLERKEDEIRAKLKPLLDKLEASDLVAIHSSGGSDEQKKAENESRRIRSQIQPLMELSEELGERARLIRKRG